MDGRQHDDELVAADAAGRFARSQQILNAQRGFNQHQIARIVPAEIVYLLESVEIQIEQRGSGAASLGEHQRAIEQIVRAEPVEQPGERIRTRHARVAFGLAAQLGRLQFQTKAFECDRVHAAQTQRAHRDTQRAYRAQHRKRITGIGMQEHALLRCERGEKDERRDICENEFLPAHEGMLHAEHADDDDEQRRGGMLAAQKDRDEREQERSDA